MGKHFLRWEHVGIGRGGLFMYDGPVETAECIWMNVGYRLD